MKTFAVELSSKGRNCKLAQKLFPEGKTMFIDATTKDNAKHRAINKLNCLINFPDLSNLKATQI